MEIVRNLEDIKNLKQNKLLGNPNISNSNITFKGKNNILFCENNVNISHSNISFEASNSLIYLSSTQHSSYSFNLAIYNNSTFFIGEDNYLSTPIFINIQENQNVIIGSGGSISTSVKIRTSDVHPIYDGGSKARVNHAGSVFIGDHVLLGHLCYISREFFIHSS